MVKRRVSRTAGVAAALLLALGLAGCGEKSGGDDDGAGAAVERTHAPQPEDSSGAPCDYPEGGEAVRAVDPPADTAAYSGTVEVTLETSEGDLAATLDASRAPCTVNSFTSLASQGYFDGTTCHRLTTAGIFVLQCGDPSASGSGGPGYSFADELTGSETYPAGTLAMANAGPGTNGSQFFVVYADTQLPANYTVFGTIDDAAIATVEKVAEAGTDDGSGDGAPLTPVKIEYVEVGEASAAAPAESTDPNAPSGSAAPAGACTYTSDGTGGETPVELPPSEPDVEGSVRGAIVTSIGRLPITLDATSAPCTVNSFVSLARQGFFDGVDCHRLTTQGILVLQCGDPTGTGMGGPGYSFPDELAGDETYPTGTLAMANSGPDTNGSQFFVVYGTTPLPPSYTVFGKVSPAAARVVAQSAKAGVQGGGSDGQPKKAVTFTKVVVPSS